MLINLQECEPASSAVFVGLTHLSNCQPWCRQILSDLEYLFWGYCADAPRLIFAGGLMSDGIPVSGQGILLHLPSYVLQVKQANKMASRTAQLIPYDGADPLNQSQGSVERTTWVCATRFPGDEIGGIPYALIRHEKTRSPAPSHGLGAGINHHAAALHGALEWVERQIVEN